MKTNKILSLMTIPFVLITGCTNDVPADPSAIVFNIEVPGALQSRAYGDGTQIGIIKYAVYENSTLFYTNSTSYTADGTNNITIEGMTRGKTYDVVFWAQNAGVSYYSFDANSGKVTIDYSNATSNDERRDAFYAKKTVNVTNNTQTESVTLSRPFAQLNIGTSDISVSGYNKSNLKASTTVSGVCNNLDLLNGSISGSETVTFQKATLPSSSLSVDGKDYTYVSMNYILSNENGSSFPTVTYTIYNGEELITTGTADMVNHKRNYRTNLTGELLTGGFTFNVTISPGFSGSYDGGNTNQGGGNTDDKENNPTPNPPANADYHEGSTWYVATLNYLKEAVGSAADGEKVLLTADIDGGGDMIQSMKVSGNTFTFDGDNHKIHNFKMGYVTRKYNNSDYSLYGLFNGASADPVTFTDYSEIAVKGMTVCNLTVENVTIGSDPMINTYGTIAPVFEGTMENVIVKDININGRSSNGGTPAGYNGGFVGVVDKNTSVTFTNCQSINMNITGENVAGFIAYSKADCTCTFNTCAVTGCTFTASSKKYIGLFIGDKNQSANMNTTGDSLLSNNKYITVSTTGIASSPAELTNLNGK